MAHRFEARPIRTKSVVETCPACGTVTRMLARADWDGERWRHRRTCWNVWCGTSWSLVEAR